MAHSGNLDRFEAADHLHSASIHFLRYAAQQDRLSRQGPARLSALSVLVFGGPKALGQLAAIEQVKPPTMSRIVAGLKRSGLAKIETDANDARRIRVSVTPNGERVLQQARRRRIQLLAKTLKGLSAPELDVLRQAANLMESAVRSAAAR